MKKIEWKVTEQNLSQELVSSDNRWHISKTQEGSAKPKFFLSNYDLLLTPHGAGADYRDCFEKFIADCDTYINKVKAARDEAVSHLTELVEAAESLENREK